MHLSAEVMDMDIMSLEISQSLFRFLQVLTHLDNLISYSGLLALDWNYTWRTRHETRKGQVFMSTEPWADCGHQKMTQFFNSPLFLIAER